MERILIIAGCSQRKLSRPAPAIELNQGQLFNAIKKLALTNNFSMNILSGKYGLLDPEEIIKPYDQKIKTQKDIIDMRKRVAKKISEIWSNYNEIIVIMGGDYRKVLEPFFDGKFFVVFDKRGIGGYLSLLSHYNKISKEEFLKEIKAFRVIECANWSGDVDIPHSCSYCYYSGMSENYIPRKSNKCRFCHRKPINNKKIDIMVEKYGEIPNKY